MGVAAVVVALALLPHVSSFCAPPPGGLGASRLVGLRPKTPLAPAAALGYGGRAGGRGVGLRMQPAGGGGNSTETKPSARWAAEGMETNSTALFNPFSKLIPKDGGSVSLEGIDYVLLINDVSVIAMYCLSQSIIETVLKGPKAVPGYTYDDAVFLAHTISASCALCFAWAVGALLTGILRRDTFEERWDVLVGVLRCYFIAGPLGLALKALAAVPITTGDTIRDFAWVLCLMCMWRYYDSTQVS